MTTITDTEAARILAELRDRYAVEPYDPAQDVTVRDVMDLLSVTEENAARYLQAEVQAGRLTKRRVRINGYSTNVYRRAAPALVSAA